MCVCVYICIYIIYIHSVRKVSTHPLALALAAVVGKKGDGKKGDECECVCPVCRSVLSLSRAFACLHFRICIHSMVHSARLCRVQGCSNGGGG